MLHHQKNIVMQKLCVVFGIMFIWFMPANVHAQGGFGGPILSVGSLANGTGIFIGGMGAYQPNNFYIGGGGFAAINAATLDVNDGTSSLVLQDFGYGGLLLGYDYPIGRGSFYVQSMFGSGGGELSQQDFSLYYAEPGVGLAYDFLPYCRARLGASYFLAVPGTSGFDHTDSFTGARLQLSLMFGYFPQNEETATPTP